MSLRVGVSVPWNLWSLSVDERRQRLAEVADAGIDHVFTADHVSFRDGSGMDGLVHLAALSGLERRLGLDVGVFLLALRHPVVAARQIASLAQAAPGRLTVGVGVGGEDRHEFEVCDVDPATRGRRTDVAIAVVRDLLDGKAVDGDGEFFRFSGARILPSPEPAVPFVVGGRSEAALVRAGRLADGWLAAWSSPDRFRQGIAQVEEAGTGREVEWRHGLQVWVGVGDTDNAARSHVAAAMKRFYGLDFEMFERYTPVGHADRIAEYLAPYVEAGASTLNLTPCGPDRHTELHTIAEVKRLLERA